MWRNIENSPMNWVIDFGKAFGSVSLPSFQGDTIYVTSDYSGTHKNSHYEVISILYMDARESLPWESLRRNWRVIYLPDGRRISFKGLTDRHKQRALMPFLQSTSSITGLVLSIVIAKNVNNIWCDELLFNQLTQLLQGKWKRQIYERAFCIAHFVALLIGGLSVPYQNICWISDEDDIFANKKKTRDVSMIVTGFKNRYTQHPLGVLELGTTAVDNENRLLEDLCAIPDLAAGALHEVVNLYSNDHDGRLPRCEPMRLDSYFSDKTNNIARWLFNYSSRLKQIQILVDKDKSGMVKMALMEIKDG